MFDNMKWYDKLFFMACVFRYPLLGIAAVGAIVMGLDLTRNLPGGSPPALPDHALTLRLSQDDEVKIRRGGFTDAELGTAFRAAVRQGNGAVPPKLIIALAEKPASGNAP